jgi:hypothetical protein
MDRDLENNGTPRWFNFIIKGTGEVKMTEKGPVHVSDGDVASFEWPIPMSVRLSYYLSRSSTTDDSDN